MSGATLHVLRPYLYANGVAYRPNLRLIHPVGDDGTPDIRPVGGVVECGQGRVLAFAADCAAILVQGKISAIMAQADAYAWGATRREAVSKIKGSLRGAGR